MKNMGDNMSDEVENFHVENARILVFGAGGAGCNTISRLTDMQLQGAITVAANTDARHLVSTKAHKKVLIGKELTRGLGAGGYPDVGRKAAEESKNEIRDIVKNCDLMFLTCGLGGGTGTGSAPVVAYMAKEVGAIVIAAVTLPFKIEGARLIKAEEGLQKLKELCDTVIVIENQKLIELAGNKALKEAFGVADNLIAMMIKGITEMISVPSLVNLYYADVRTIMRAGGVATIGVGESTQSNSSRAKEAIEKALDHPLLDVDYHGATGALIQVIGGNDMKLEEINEIGEEVAQHMDSSATVMWGARIVPEFEGKIQVITVITGVKSPYIIGKGQQTQKTSSHASSGHSKIKTNDLGIEVLI